MYPSPTSAFWVSLLLAPLPIMGMLRCENIRVDDFSFDLSKLGNPHSVVTSRYESIPQAHFNRTYTIDICRPLKKSGKADPKQECPNGTRACAITHLLKGDVDTVTEVIAIAGSLEDKGGTSFEFDVTRLSTSDSNSDSKKEGLRLVLKGGKHPLDGPQKERREQKAVIEFLCDPNKEGTEGEWKSEDEYDKESILRREEKEGDGEDGKGESGVEHQLKKDDAALIWESYTAEGDADILRMTWHTKYACEKRDGGGDGGGAPSGGEGDVSSHWGFFTWFVLIVFMSIATYLIFGSWLNYNRYGARGWDLVPHGDTIRDLPYLFKDWIRRVLNTVQGTGSRGGYSAV